ncbi:amino acid permease-domain-containing protein [Colletotrichum cereale]|nr:amino acid permease-domain-containing protein [Colletotrichum cereale]
MAKYPDTGSDGPSLCNAKPPVLRVGGPGFLMLAYGLLSLVVYGIVTAIAEVGAYLPVTGGAMSYYGGKYVSRSFGFAMGYLYWYSLGVLVPYELVAANLLVDYWSPSPAVSPAVCITLLLVVVTTLNFPPGARILLILGLVFLSAVLFFGGGPDHDMLGFRYWKDPGATKPCLVEGAGGTFVAFLQAVVLYIPIVIGFGVVCPHNDPQLSASGTVTSPFVIAIRHAGIPVLDHVVNAMILLSAATAGNAFLYQSSRSLYSLAVCGDAPAVFRKCNRHGLPYMAVGASSLSSLLAYLSLSNTSLLAFNWLVNITNTAGYISWICCGLIYVKLKEAARHHGVESPYRPWIQPYGIYFGAFGSVLLLFVNGLTVFFPGQWSVSGFLTVYVGIPAFLFIYAGHRFCHRSDDWVRKPGDVDMFEGLDQVLAAERPPPARGWLASKLMVLIE